MNIDKAIKMLKEIDDSTTLLEYHDYPDALKLGIEALKTVRVTRRVHYYNFIDNLPGETKD